MPALKNHRQERFCQLVKQGIPPYRAYPEAGYKAHNGEPYRLRENPRVKARIAEITRSLAVKTAVTVASITDDLDRIMRGAEAAEQFAAAKGAVDSKAKLHGLVVERTERGAPGDFGTQSEAQTLELVRAELGEAAAATLAQALAKLDQLEARPAEADQADVDPPHIESTNEGSGTLN